LLTANHIDQQFVGHVAAVLMLLVRIAAHVARAVAVAVHTFMTYSIKFQLS